MNLLLSRLAAMGLNRKRFNQSDFYNFCEHEQIEVIRHKGEASWYMEFRRRPFICLSESLTGFEELFTMFHELGHHFLHSGRHPEQAMFNCMIASKEEFEANAVALLAMFPSKDLERDAATVADDAYGAALFCERYRLFREYGV